MAHQNPPDAIIRQLLSDARTIAVVGASSNPERPSNEIFAKLLSYGYRVIPVNPNETQVHGQPAFASLGDVPVSIDIVNVFRRPEHALALAEEAIAVGAKMLWLQSGVSDEAAAARAKAGGLVVVMDACIMVMHSLLHVPHVPRVSAPG